jgi:RHH-type proline utilization regulon transcriptional repressor/proline dehydrogenase/delta 1-pyrroline-5-carboxylate dehydrogenase
VSFENEPLADLRIAAERDRLRTALEALDGALPLRVPVIIGEGRRVGEELRSTDPGQPDRAVALAAAASEEEVGEAVARACEAARSWGALPADARADTLRGAAANMRSRRHALAALAVRECAKPWREADADVCEAIDFLEYYALAAVALASGGPLPAPAGERNTLRWRPRGVTAVIAPWNFPFAIATGMTAGALAAGNPVCLKPAEQSPGCALAIVEALRSAGVPAGALSLLPGDGEPGARLVGDPRVSTVAFTGSVAVGREIMAASAGGARVIAEMGGKNCVIVDADADLDEVVPAVLHSAFAFAGQKCSAASRTLVHERIAGVLAERLVGALETLLVDQAERFGTDVPPLIEADAAVRVERHIADAAAAGAAVRRGASGPGGGHFVAPTIVVDPPADGALVREEIFGPVLTLETVANVEAACELVEALPLALTGGLFSRNPRTVAMVAGRTPVGNLYVNRAITGARVGRQPFGGNRQSGTGAKAGGPGYLEYFADGVVVTENTMRHGLAL